MRTDKQIYDLILATARADDRIRAVVLNGSRANPDAPRDRFQDFDVVFVVTAVKDFVRDPGWIDRFGERMVTQTPDDMGETLWDGESTYAYLMQFMDGTRIDLTLFPMAKVAAFPRDSLSVLLFDKDGLIPPFPAPSGRDYLPKPPTAKEFADCCNEFWWVCPYVAKGLWRDELPYARFHLDEVLRPQLRQMLDWYFGSQTGFARGPGKFGKNLKRELEPELWALFEATYADARPESAWAALRAMGELIRIAGRRVAGEFGFEYPEGDDARVSAYVSAGR